MFDFGFDKMIVVAVLVGIILGPERLRELRRALPRHLGRLHELYQQGRAQVVDELNEFAPDWREYDPRQLHPRRILQDLNAAAAASAVERATSRGGPGEPSGRLDDAHEVHGHGVPESAGSAHSALADDDGARPDPAPPGASGSTPRIRLEGSSASEGEADRDG
ncbi:Sec-independent protein translocase subunit TatA/TatB [Microbacterium hydrothermale]|uniref:Sec-independent protein translocase subunit TatA/TatB n=1 Tax=Microbacterium hydrothermale TaxID=857427 RepID=UPI0010A85EC6|nr:twin-arginine translocase TatA/TatE family subunit [Microbacterium hydrothermale]